MPINNGAGETDAHDEHIVAARRILAEVPLIDGHNDFPWMVRGWHKNQITSADFNIDNLPIGQTDLVRLARGQLGGQFWSAFVPCPAATECDSERRLLEIVRTTIQQIDLIHLLIQRYPDTFGFVETSQHILANFRSGKIASLIGVEGLHQIGRSLSVLRMYHRLGVRYITLCHNSSNEYVDSATCPKQPNGGVSDAGRVLLKEMNRVGMMIDLSHTSETAQAQALAVSEAPVIFSHSSCFALCPSPRNVSDDVLSQLRANKGIIMICFAPSMIASSSGKAGALGNVVDHIIYAGERIGFEHVGIGSDFDGMLEGPEGLDEVSCYPALIATLLRRGMSEECVKMVMGLNIIRVMADVEKVSSLSREARKTVLSDVIEDVWTSEQRAMLVAKGAERKARALDVDIE